MTLRTRIALAAAAVVATTATLVSVIVFVALRRNLAGQVDASLRAGMPTLFLPVTAGARPSGVPASAPEIVFGNPQAGDVLLRGRHIAPSKLGAQVISIQLVPTRGVPTWVSGVRGQIPPSEADRAVAAGTSGDRFTSRTIKGVHVRVLTAKLIPGTAVQVARPLTELDSTLHRLLLLLVVVTLAATVVAALAGRAVARALLAPLRHLSTTVGLISRTGDLDQRVNHSARDELGSLARQFDSMLDSLRASKDAQERLVADASHELRTPLTSARTNVELVARDDSLSPEERRERLGTIDRQLRELSSLTNDLESLAQGERPVRTSVRVALGALCESAVERVQARRPDVRMSLTSDTSEVLGDWAELERAVVNVLDNAAKWSPPGGQVEVVVCHGEITVRDHGPGVDAEDLPRIFDRFYRSPAARGTAGSGLGLAIVRQVVEEHGGTIESSSPPGGGASFHLRFPVLSESGHLAQ